MSKFLKYAAHPVAPQANEGRVIRRNHLASAAFPTEVQGKIASMGLQRVAGNVFSCPASKDFWAVRGNKIVKLVSNEVDDGSSIPAAPKDKPMAFLTSILDDLTL